MLGAADGPEAREAPARSRAPAASRRCARLLVYLTALAVAIPVARQARIAWSLGDTLSSRADPYSEADAARSAEGYAERGFRVHHGLPDVLYGRQFPESGMRTEPWLAGQSSHIYTHYPPGPNWIAGVMARLCGTGRLRWYRLAPLLVGTVALGFYAWALAARLGSSRGLLLLVLTLVPRMTTHMMHGLHYQGYAQSLLLAQLGVLLLLLRRPSSRPTGGWLALVSLGFAQGWLSFDHVFLVAGSAVPLWLASAAPAGSPLRSRGRTLLLAVTLPAGGFIAAHALHLLQVVLELGGVAAAVADFREVARWRAVGSGAPLGAWGPLVILREYLLQHVPRGSYFGAWTYLWAAGTALLVSVPALRWTAPWRARAGSALRVDWQPAVNRRRRALALLAALVVSAAWIMIMRNHAHHHPHFLPRHFFVLYFTGMLLLVEGLRPRNPAPPAS